MKRVHDRTPVNLDLCAAEQWLKADVDGEAARTLLGPLNEETVQLRSVGSHVNNVRHEDPACIEPQAEL
jgi:putative SOS response-associated peptidase YedK